MTPPGFDEDYPLRLRVLQVSTETGWGGGENQVSFLCRYLMDAGHEVFVACPEPSELMRALSDSEARFRAFHAKGDFDLGAWRRLAGIVREVRPHIVHSHGSPGLMASIIAGRAVPEAAQVFTRRVAFPIRGLSQWKYRLAPVRYIGVSGAVRDVLCHAGIPEERIRVVHSGVDVRRFCPREDGPILREELGIPLRVPVILSVGNLHRVKGHETLIEAVPRIIEAFPESVFLIAGEGPERETLEKKIRGIVEGAKKVRLLGRRSDVPALIAASTVCVLPSLSEGFPNFLLESLACGKPVVASAVDGVLEILRDGENGLLVSPGDADQVAEASIRFLSDGQFAQQTSEKGREEVVRSYSMEAMAAGTLLVYRDVLRGRNGEHGAAKPEEKGELS